MYDAVRISDTTVSRRAVAMLLMLLLEKSITLSGAGKQAGSSTVWPPEWYLPRVLVACACLFCHTISLLIYGSLEAGLQKSKKFKKSKQVRVQIKITSHLVKNWNFNVQSERSASSPTLGHFTLWLRYLLTYFTVKDIVKNALRTAPPWQDRRNRPQWCQVANIKWSSHKDSDVLTDNRTFSNVINSSNSITVVVLVVVVVLAI